MSRELQFKTILQWRIAIAAINDAWRDLHAFDVASLCKKHNLKDTRHMRAVLKVLVSEGWLFSYLQCGKDGSGGRRRRMYCAQQTILIEVFANQLVLPEDEK